MKSGMSTQTMMRVAILGAISVLLFELIEIPVVAFYKLDFSGVPVMLAGFALGPVNGLITLAIKDLIGIIFSETGGIGEAADFFMLAAMLLPAALFYKKNRTRKTALAGMAVGTLAMTIMGVVLNYFVLIPLYATLFNMTTADIVAMASKAVPAADSLLKVVLFITAPFNILKGVVVSVITYALYGYLSPILKKGYR